MAKKKRADNLSGSVEQTFTGTLHLAGHRAYLRESGGNLFAITFSPDCEAQGFFAAYVYYSGKPEGMPLSVEGSNGECDGDPVIHVTTIK